MNRSCDAVVVSAEPNALAAAIAPADVGYSVVVLEANETIGGGCRSEAIALAGFVHDTAARSTRWGSFSPFSKRLPLRNLGVELIRPPAAVPHPFDDGTVAVLSRSFAKTGDTIGRDGHALDATVGAAFA